MPKVLVLLAKGFEEIEAICVIDVLRRGGLDVLVAAVGDSTDVTGAHGLHVTADARFPEVSDDTYDAIVLPGGNTGTKNLRESESVLARLRRQKEEDRYICAICAAPLVLMTAGVLDEGVHVTCYPTCQKDLDRPWSAAPVVADGKIITGQAPGASLLFGLVILQHLTDETLTSRVARGLVTDVI